MLSMHRATRLCRLCLPPRSARYVVGVFSIAGASRPGLLSATWRCESRRFSSPGPNHPAGTTRPLSPISRVSLHDVPPAAAQLDESRRQLPHRPEPSEAGAVGEAPSPLQPDVAAETADADRAAAAVAEGVDGRKAAECEDPLPIPTDQTSHDRLHPPETGAQVDPGKPAVRSAPTADVEETEPKATIAEALRFALPHLWPEGRWDHRVRVLASLGLVICAKAFSVAVPFYFKGIIDGLVTASPSAAGAAASGAAAASSPPTLAVSLTTGFAESVFGIGIFSLVAAYGVSRLMASFSNEARTAVFAWVSADAFTNINEKVFLKLHNMDLAFHLGRKTGGLTRVLDRGSRAFSNIAWCVMFVVFPTVFEMTLVCGLLQAQVGVEFVVIASMAVLVYVGWTTAVTNWRSQFRDKFNTKETVTSTTVVDSLLNYETVKYFGSEKYEAQRLRKANEDMNVYVVKLEQSMSFLNFGQQAVFIAAATASFYFAATGVLAGTMTVGDLVLVDSLLMQLYSPLSWLGIVYRELLTSTQNLQSMLGLLDADIKVKDRPDARNYQYNGGQIELSDAVFAYNESRQVLRGVSLTIPPGSHVAFVGPSGTGKSTIFRLIFRFFNLDSGRILVDGQDIDTVVTASLRSKIGVIPQDTVMFNDTIGFNIEYGKLGATHEEVVSAAKAAHIHDAIMSFPDAYDTVVGERGLKLSGGEKQRLAIARVLLKDPPIILADEATSALDTSTEAAVVNTLRSSTSATGGRRTVVMIAHRLATVRRCDVIFVLNARGELHEQGTHDDLISRGGLYCQLWNEQKGRSPLG